MQKLSPGQNGCSLCPFTRHCVRYYWGTSLKVAGIQTPVKDFAEWVKSLDSHKAGNSTPKNKSLNSSKPVPFTLVNKT